MLTAIWQDLSISKFTNQVNIKIMKENDPEDDLKELLSYPVK